MKNDRDEIAELIRSGRAVLGIELGSTRIKAALIAPDTTPLASGAHSWESQLKDGVWTYDMADVWAGLSSCYAALVCDVMERYSVLLSRVAALGISGMMHGYVALDADGNLLVPFRTWRNNITGQACAELTPLLDFAVPQRWTIAHLYQSILEKQPHLSKLARLTTLAGYVHYQLTGEHVVGVGEASGIFPIDPNTGDWDRERMQRFDALLAKHGLGFTLGDILPRVLPAGRPAGKLTVAGAERLDPTGRLEAGVPLCPPEGDAGTGMVATNAVRPRSGNVSAGTSVFAMIVLEKSLSKVHEEIDIVATPDGKPVAMAHANNGLSDLDAWFQLFSQVVRAGEHVTGFTEGRPLFARHPTSRFTLENFLRALYYSSLCAVRTGIEVLTKQEGVVIDEIRGHGGFFKAGDVGQRLMAAALGVPVSVPATAGEGGAWGMAVLAAYLLHKDQSLGLAEYLDAHIASTIGAPVAPEPKDVQGFEQFYERHKKGLAVEAAAILALE